MFLVKEGIRENTIPPNVKTVNIGSPINDQKWERILLGTPSVIFVLAGFCAWGSSCFGNISRNTKELNNMKSKTQYGKRSGRKCTYSTINPAIAGPNPNPMSTVIPDNLIAVLIFSGGVFFIKKATAVPVKAPYAMPSKILAA
ncbi:hypothetical protein GCM10007199_25090 [Fictibacillus barbaricus]|nr:hypothetical protein GCM10007199_25090 [Fictibacillus barbaricus]